MRLRRKKRDTLTRMNMTPMIDIVFLLIIFFMTVTQVSEVNRRQVELPRQAGMQEQRPTVMTINVTEGGQIEVSGIALDLDRLAVWVADTLVELGDDPNRLSIVIRADQRGDSRAVNQIVKLLAGMQIQQVRIAVQVPRK